ncbi:MAG: iron ABC transporter permease [Candidatus Aureabacteria bacterium]|nr:iron ABC transporter permease [Candidatus Auribacterota bacterium]
MRTRSVFIILFVLFGLAVWLGISYGSVSIPFRELLSENNRQILYLRLSRVIMALIAGCGLSVSGIILQALLKNPLADPYLLGTSSGAGLGAVMALLLGLSGFFLPFFAWLGAILSVILVLYLSRENTTFSSQSLILSGVIVSIALSSVLVLILSLSPNETLHGILWWLWGNLQILDLRLLVFVSFFVLCGTLLTFFFSQDLNAISLGEEEAIHLGISIESVKIILIATASLMTASLVCICGVIGFVGLMVPHMMRRVTGANHNLLLPATCLASGVFMIVCDTLSRTIYPPIEIPIGVITSMLGTPVFFWLFKKKRDGI